MYNERAFLKWTVTVYLLVVAAMIIDVYPLKYFWIAVRGCLVLSSGKILFPTPVIYTHTTPHILSPQHVYSHNGRVLTIFFTQFV